LGSEAFLGSIGKVSCDFTDNTYVNVSIGIILVKFFNKEASLTFFCFSASLIK
jgi:hypothetical protein